jgi:hypothetical protein
MKTGAQDRMESDIQKEVEMARLVIDFYGIRPSSGLLASNYFDLRLRNEGKVE